MERGGKLPEAAIPRRAGKIHGDPSHSEAPTFTSSTAFCYTGERHTNKGPDSQNILKKKFLLNCHFLIF